MYREGNRRLMILIMRRLFINVSCMWEEKYFSGWCLELLWTKRPNWAKVVNHCRVFSFWYLFINFSRIFPRIHPQTPDFAPSLTREYTLKLFEVSLISWHSPYVSFFSTISHPWVNSISPSNGDPLHSTPKRHFLVGVR